MSQLPWITVAEVDPGTPVTIMGSRLELRSHLFSAGFMSAAMRIRRQLAASDGLVGYSLETQVGRKTFWTVSAWTDEKRLRAFTAADPHRSSTKAIRPRIASSTFVFWNATSGDLPVGWDEVHERIAARRADEAG